MQVLNIHLRDFRNYTDRRFVFSDEGAVLCGPNGCGKTNLFEAMAYCAFGRSFRTRTDQDLPRYDSGGFRIECQARWDELDHTFEAVWKSGGVKRISLDGARVERISDLYQWLRLIYLSPVDIEIVSGAAGVRRRFFDQAVSQRSFAYVESFRRYTQALTQRNALLKTRYTVREKHAWDVRFCESAAEVVRQRLDYLDAFTTLASDYYRAISGASEELGVRYVHSLPREDGDDWLSQYTQHADKVAERESRQQRTLLGPHLDDMLFLLDGRPARKFASQGQQRSLAIALRLAQAKLIEQQVGESPVLVFDDVLAELDPERAARVLQHIEPGCQVFVARPDCHSAEEHGLPLVRMQTD